MIGSRLATLRPRPGRAVTCLVVGVGIIALGVAGGLPTLVPLAACPLAIGSCLFFIGERRFQARFAPDALDISRPRQTIPYRSILEVRPLGPPGKPRPHSFPIQVVHARGGIVIPPRLTAPSERVYAFLGSFVPERLPRILPPALEDYRVEQEGTFGADRVWCYGGRRGTDLPRVRGLRAPAARFPLPALGWVGLPLPRPGGPGWWGGAAA